MPGAGARIDAAVGELCATLQAALRAAADSADAGGIVVSTDPDRVDRGGAWVSPREATPANLADAFEVVCHVWLIAADADEPTARAQLSRSLDVVADLVDLADDEAIDLAGSIALPNNPTTRLPAYRLIVTIETE